MKIVSTPVSKIIVIFAVIFTLCNLKIKSQVTYTWNGIVSSEWNNGNNWTPLGPPLNTDHVIIVASPNDPGLSNNVTLEDFEINSGALNLSGFTLTSEGNQSFSGGNILNGTFQSNNGNLTTFSATTFDANIDISSDRITLSGGVFNNPVVLEQTGATNTSGAGNAIFNNALDFTLSGTGYFRTNGNNTFNGDVFVTNNGGDYILFELTTGSVYNSDVFITNNSTSNIRMAFEGNSVFNGNIEFNNTSTGQIVFCERVSSSATLGAGVQMFIGGTGFDSGFLILRRMVQSDATNQSLTLGGTADLGSIDNVWDGNVSFIASSAYTSNSVYNGTAYFENNGAGNSNSGGNIFNQNTTLVNSSGNEMRFGITNPDIFNGQLSLLNSGTSNLQISRNFAGNEFNNDVIIENTSTGNIHIGIYGGTSTLADGFSFQIGGLGFDEGNLFITNVTQLGLTFQNLSVANTARITLNDNVFNAVSSFTSGRIFLSNNVFNNNLTIEKTGAPNDNSEGGNTFNASTTITNSGTGYMLFANANPDIFNDVLSISNSGASHIYLAHNSIGNEFNANITIESIGSRGVLFGNAGGTSILGNNVEILVGAGGFDSGDLGLSNFTQFNAVDQNITLTGTARVLSRSSVWDGEINFVTPRIFLMGSIFNNLTYLEKNGSADDDSRGGNTFNSNTTIVNSGSGRIRLGSNVADAPDIFNADLVLRNTGDDRIMIADANLLNEFNGNVQLECTLGFGIRFGENQGTATLANGFQFSIGALGYSESLLRFRNVTQIGVSPQTLTLTGTGYLLSQNSTWNGNVQFIAPRIYTDGSSYNGTAYLEKTDATNDDSPGGNVFNQITTIANSGSGRLLFGNTNPDVFNDETTIISSGSNAIWMAHNSIGNQFNHNIIVESTGTSNGVEFGRGGAGDVTLADGFTVSVGAGGFSNGILRFRNFTQVGLTPQNLTLTGTGYILHQESNWGGDINFIAPRYYTSSTIYNGNSYLEKTGTSDDDSPGNNIFHQDAIIVNSGDRRLRFATTDPDIFNGNTFVRNTGTSVIWMADNSSGNQFNGNIQVESVGSNGITFGRGGGGDATMAATYTVTVGPLGFDSGELIFNTFTQVGPTPQSLTLTGTGYCRNFESIWNGDVQFIAPRMYTRGTVYNGTTYLEKTGASGDPSYGNNIFNQNTSLVNSGTNYFGMGWTDPDIFNGDLLVQATNEGVVHIAYNSSGNILNGDLVVENTSNNQIIYFNETANGDMTFNGNIELNSSVNANGIRFGNGTLNASFLTQAAGSTITIGPGGFHNGELRFVNFTKVGADAVNLTLNNSGFFRSFESVWNGDVQFVSPRIYTRGTTYNGSAYLEKTGTTDDASAGNNVFNDITTLVNSGIRYFGMGFTDPDVFNADLNVRNTGTFYVTLAYNSAGNQFNGNVQLESDNGQGVRIGLGNGSSTLATGMQFSIGALGFSEGELEFRNVTQIGNTPQNLTLTSNATFESYNAVWNGPVDFRSPRHYTRGTTYNNTAYLEKTGTGNDASVGGNTFNDETSIVNSGVGYFMPANGTGNDFNANVSFIQNNTGIIYPCYNSASTFAGDININYNLGQIYFGATTNGRAILDGNTDQNINDLGTSTLPLFRDLQVSKPSGDVYLNMPIEITVELDLDQGVIFSDAVNLISMSNNSFVSSVSDVSHINGPVRKIGNDAFDFPVGKGGFYRPISISAPSNTAHHFTAEFFNTNPDDSDGMDPAPIDAGITNISDCEHWILDRTNGASNVNVTLSYRPYGTNGCSGVADLSALTIARWDGAMWVNHPGTAVGNPIGSITTNAAVTSFSPFALATTSNTNPLPIELVSFTAKANGNQVDLEWQTASEINNDFFTIERSKDGTEFEVVTTVKGAGNSTALLNYKTVDSNPYSGTSFYRLKQTDFDGAFEYSEVRRVEIEGDGIVNVYPNPVLGSDERFIVDVSGFQNGADEIIILDALGKIVYSKSENLRGQVDVETAFLNSGIYFVRVVVGENLYHKKVVIK